MESPGPQPQIESFSNLIVEVSVFFNEFFILYNKSFVKTCEITKYV